MAASARVIKVVAVGNPHRGTMMLGLCIYRPVARGGGSLYKTSLGLDPLTEKMYNDLNVICLKERKGRQMGGYTHTLVTAL